MRIIISYPFKLDQPLYPETPAPETIPYTSIESGDSSNTTMIKYHNHSGTHIDLPLHFCPGGASLKEYCDEYPLVFSPSYCFDIEKNRDEMIVPDDFSAYEELCTDAEAILFRTGFWRYRETGGGVYDRDHPWVHPSVPEYLRNTFKNIRLFGIDTISVATPNHRAEGRESHRNFLCGKKPILLLEDADFRSPSLLGVSFSLEIYPSFYGRIDGTPVTVMVFFD